MTLGPNRVYTGAMPQNAQVLTPVGRVIESRIIGRTAEEFTRLGAFLEDHPDEWYLYSTHVTPGAARNRASVLRNKGFPKMLLPWAENLEFRSARTEEHGPVVQVRYASTPS